jgi:dipeptide/tripeptide permease
MEDGSLLCPTGRNDTPSLPFSPGSGRCKACDYEASACGDHTLMSDYSVFYQIPQYLLVGIAEILISVPSYEMFYSEVPEELKSACQSLNLLTATFGGMYVSLTNYC